MSVIQTTENPKNGKIGAEIRASVYKKTLEFVFSKKSYKALNYRRHDIQFVPSCKHNFWNEFPSMLKRRK